MSKLGKALALAERERDHTRGRNKAKPVEWLHRVDVIDMLERLEIPNITHSAHDELNFSCPFPGHNAGDSRPSAYMNDGSSEKEKATVWKCHGCGRAGNAISFVAEHEDISKQKATQWLRELYASGFREPKGGIAEEFEARIKKREELQRQRDVEAISWKIYERKFEIDWFKDQDHKPMQYMLKRGFEPKTLQRWRIGYDPLSERLTIPVTNVDGELIGVKGRTFKSKQQERNKYFILGDAKGKPKKYGFLRYEKSKVLFGLDWWAGETDTLVLCEGELDVIALWQIGIPAVSTGSSSVSEEQAILLRNWCDNVVIYFDLDGPGINAIAGYEKADGEWKPGLVQRLTPFLNVTVIVNHDGDAATYQEAHRASEVVELVRNAVPAHRLMLD